MECELFTPQIRSIPVVASDEAGGLPGVLTPERPVLTWKNYLTSPSSTELLAVARPPVSSRLSVPVISFGCGAAIVFLLAVMWRQWRAGQKVSRLAAVASIAVFVLGVLSFPAARFAVGNPFSGRLAVTDQEASEVLQTLLHNVYRSFDHHNEEVIYDRLARSISGELLTDIYLQARRSMEVKNQGGLRISVKEVVLTELEPTDEEGSDWTYRCGWRVRGWIGHWGHIHARENQHMATITIADRDGQWKITAMEILDPSPAEPAVSSPIIRRGGEA
jgi:hypothetical protein